jgi:hypothetical protein
MTTIPRRQGRSFLFASSKPTTGVPWRRVARWYIFKPKIPIFVKFGGPPMLLYVFYDHLEYFTAIWYISWPFRRVCGNLVSFLRFGMFGPRKIWQPWPVTCEAEEKAEDRGEGARLLGRFRQRQSRTRVGQRGGGLHRSGQQQFGGQCWDHYFLQIFGEKNERAFVLKSKAVIRFLHRLAVICVTNVFCQKYF